MLWLCAHCHSSIERAFMEIRHFIADLTTEASADMILVEDSVFFVFIVVLFFC